MVSADERARGWQTLEIEDWERRKMAIHGGFSGKLHPRLSLSIAAVLFCFSGVSRSPSASFSSSLAIAASSSSAAIPTKQGG